ncbi:NAD-dependent protein deacetylase [Aeromicrobium phragmitis]|uniref:protein acetyllysine N-acetyltransferase n=1 Tax=Aeromicrobium phragmitis TaxID=2478914 RepID=A0A3L8PQN2_9ACTN|nr:NAD-dependent protein deacetylase [Aeromicrobium phragmitis]RLV57159.1 NAD-dependent protein deacetylase [Aeromicrobium phragmitis]
MTSSPDWTERRWLVLTGAGVSTDSGIPDYRGPDAPPRAPMTYQEFIASERSRQRYWARAHVGWSHMREAEPNATHLDLVRRQHQGQLLGLITQNVDGLHEKAGHRDVIDLHGRIDRVICLDCGQVTSRRRLHDRLRALNPGWEDREAEVAPDGDVLIDDTGDFVVAPCENCGGRLKPDVVFFGETVPKQRVARCFDLVDQASREDAALVVIGSSLQVMSGLRFVRRAAKDGTAIVIINRGTTRGDDLADVKIDAGAAETLTALALAG